MQYCRRSALILSRELDYFGERAIARTPISACNFECNDVVRVVGFQDRSFLETTIAPCIVLSRTHCCSIFVLFVIEAPHQGRFVVVVKVCVA